MKIKMASSTKIFVIVFVDEKTLYGTESDLGLNGCGLHLCHLFIATRKRSSSPDLWIHLCRVGFGAHVCYHCRISPPRFLDECRKRRLNQGSFVLLYFNLSTLFDLYLVFACLFSCTVFVLSFCMFIFLYCFVCQYQSSDWL